MTKKHIIGKVVSAKVPNMVVVLIERRKKHPLFKKVIRQKTKVYVHDELGAKEGSMVRLSPTRPRSKLKHFRVTEIMEEKK